MSSILVSVHSLTELEEVSTGAGDGRLPSARQTCCHERLMTVSTCGHPAVVSRQTASALPTRTSALQLSSAALSNSSPRGQAARPRCSGARVRSTKAHALVRESLLRSSEHIIASKICLPSSRQAWVLSGSGPVPSPATVPFDLGLGQQRPGRKNHRPDSCLDDDRHPSCRRRCDFNWERVT